MADSDRTIIRNARRAIAEALPDAAASAGIASMTTPAGDSITLRSPSELAKDYASLSSFDRLLAGGGAPIILNARVHRD